MNPSTAALQRSQRSSVVSFEALAERFKEKGLYPKDGRALSVDGSQIIDLMRLGTLAKVEQRINDLVMAVRNAKTQSNDQKLQEAIALATESKDSFELHYLASMFINHKEVMRSLAANPSIDERTQLILIADETMRDDAGVQMSLAHNPSLTDAAMVKLVKAAGNPHVQLGVAVNAARRSNMSQADANPFSELCVALAGAYDSVVRRSAIEGIRDPEALRKIAWTHSVALAPRELEAVARNARTPDDVLLKLATTGLPKLQPYLSIAVSTYARSTLAQKGASSGAAVSPTPNPA